jgi:sugar/nucleoside kinase (ribokinase family)
MPRLGVLGTMVWDRIFARDGRREPVEEWGGISYALAAAAAARPDGWQIVPVLKIGRDLEEEAFRFLRSLPGLELDSGVRIVPEPTNLVELRYRDRERRCERLTGGVTPWSHAELEPLLADFDALYINFISGFELDLDTAVRLRLGFPGPIYADLHSIFLGIDQHGNRTPRPLASWREWLRCFDIVQMNEEELATLTQAWGDPWLFAADVVGEELRLILVTLGSRGSAYVASPWFRRQPLEWRERGLRTAPPLTAPGGPVTSELMPPADAPPDGDPTGCGDVYGATAFLRLLAGDDLDASIHAAQRAAARNFAHRGAGGLYPHLLGRIGP